MGTYTSLTGTIPPGYHIAVLKQRERERVGEMVPCDNFHCSMKMGHHNACDQTFCMYGYHNNITRPN